MTPPVVTAHPETPLVAVARLLVERTIAQVPVMDQDGVLLGMIRQQDIVAAVAVGAAGINQPHLLSMIEGYQQGIGRPPDTDSDILLRRHQASRIAPASYLQQTIILPNNTQPHG